MELHEIIALIITEDIIKGKSFVSLQSIATGMKHFEEYKDCTTEKLKSIILSQWSFDFLERIRESGNDIEPLPTTACFDVIKKRRNFFAIRLKGKKNETL